MAAKSPDHGHAISSEYPVGGHDGELILDRLRGKHTIERIAMMEWQLGHFHDVCELEVEQQLHLV
jgi:hypothetical protein